MNRRSTVKARGMPASDKPAGERIAKLLARAGVASRREVERMIAEGRIALNGDKIETPATILPNLRGVTVDGKPIAKPEPTRLFRFHKPAGLITAERDPAGRPTIYTARSEEHTSELQSRENLVCRLLLEKKNNTQLP